MQNLRFILEVLPRQVSHPFIMDVIKGILANKSLQEFYEFLLD